MNFKKQAASLLLATTMFFSLSACNNNVEICINVKNNDVYKYHTSTSVTSSSEISGTNVGQKQDTTTDFKVTVKGKDSKGNFIMDYMYDTIKFKSETDAQTESYDSSTSDSNDSSNIYNNIIGKSFTAKMTKYGEITEISDNDDILDIFFESYTAGMTDEESIESMKNSIESSYGDNALKSLIQQSTEFFPKKDIKEGDSWNIESTINSIVEIKTNTTYTLDKIEDQTAHISLQSEFSTDGLETHDYSGMDMTADLSGNMTGTIKFDTTNGFLSEGEFTQNISGEMSVVVPSTEGSEQETVAVPIDLTAKTTYSTTKM